MRLRRILKDAKVLIIRPGDVLVIEMSRPITAQQAQTIKDTVQSRLDAVSDVLVLSDPARLAAIYRGLDDLREASA